MAMLQAWGKCTPHTTSHHTTTCIRVAICHCWGSATSVPGSPLGRARVLFTHDPDHICAHGHDHKRVQDHDPTHVPVPIRATYVSPGGQHRQIPHPCPRSTKQLPLRSPCHVPLSAQPPDEISHMHAHPASPWLSPAAPGSPLATGTYSSTAYFISKTATELPLAFLQSVVTWYPPHPPTSPVLLQRPLSCASVPPAVCLRRLPIRLIVYWLMECNAPFIVLVLISWALGIAGGIEGGYTGLAGRHSASNILASPSAG